MIPFLKLHASPRSAIVNLSSISAQLPAAMLSIYAATKAFDDAFSYTLSSEVRNCVELDTNLIVFANVFTLMIVTKLMVLLHS